MKKTIDALPPHDRILQTAHALFYRDGVRATGIDRVIAEAGVTKVTFYRHFPSKNDLVLAYLDYRHGLWMEWFRASLAKHARRGAMEALARAMEEWFGRRDYRGCAFINTVVELDGALPQTLMVARAHKEDMVRAIAELLPAAPDRQARAEAAAMAADGAMVRAQMEASPQAAVAVLRSLLRHL